MPQVISDEWAQQGKAATDRVQNPHEGDDTNLWQNPIIGKPGASTWEWKGTNVRSNRNTAPQTGGSASASVTGGGGGGAPATNFTSVQANPYLDKVFGAYDQLMKRYGDLSEKSLDPTAAIKDYERMRKQGWDEANANAGARGFGPGSSLSMKSNFTQGTEQGAQKLSADWANNNLGFQKDLLTGMAGALGGQGGVGGNIQAGQLGLINAGNDAQRTQMEYSTRMAMLPIQLLQAQLQAAQSAMALV